MGSELTDPLLFLAFQYMSDNLNKKKEGQEIIVLHRILSSDDVNFGYDEGRGRASTLELVLFLRSRLNGS